MTFTSKMRPDRHAEKWNEGASFEAWEKNGDATLDD